LKQPLIIEKKTFYYILGIEYYMVRLSDLEAAILGLLYEHHHYAYRLEQIIKKRGMRNWAEIGFSSIYYVLKRLEEKKLVESKLRKVEGKPSRKVYTISPEGKIAMEQKVKQILSENQKHFSSFDLAMANSQILKTVETVECLKLYLKSTDERIEFLEKSIIMQESNNSPANVIALFTRPLALLKAEEEWVQDFIKILENESIKK
jgi:DNA-binding PadR family transcriptional regulator